MTEKCIFEKEKEGRADIGLLFLCLLIT